MTVIATVFDPIAELRTRSRPWQAISPQALAGDAPGAVPYRLRRRGTVMSPAEGDPLEAEGVLNPASGWGADGRLYLLPRLVSAGNVSRIGLAEIDLTDGVPTGVQRRGIALEPAASWEQDLRHAGVEDARTTWVPALGVHVMTYVAYGPLGPRPALAVSADVSDVNSWHRLGPLTFEYEPELGADLNLYPNKDVLVFPEVVPGPDGTPSFAMLHRPMWDLSWIVPGAGEPLPDGLSDPRPGIWISYVPAEEVTRDLRRLNRVRHHRLVALSNHAFEQLKIGGGPPPLRIPEGWLLLHHGVVGELLPGVDQQPLVNYSAGAMILSADDPAVVIARTAQPLLSAEHDHEKLGIVPNVVFPTAIERIGDRDFVFYGMADSRIGVAELERTAP